MRLFIAPPSILFFVLLGLMACCSSASLGSQARSVVFEPRVPEGINRITILDVDFHGEVRTFIPGRLQLRESRTDSEGKDHLVHSDLCDSLGEVTHPGDDARTESGEPIVIQSETSAKYMRIITLQLRAGINSARYDCRSFCNVELPTPELLCPGSLLAFYLPANLSLHAGPSYFVIKEHIYDPAFVFSNSSAALVSINAANVSVAVMQVPPTLTFGVMTHRNPNEYQQAQNLRLFIDAVRALSIPAVHYEIVVAGPWPQNFEANFSAEDGLDDIVHVCAACEFSDKIRSIFEVAAHEFVWVSHDYIIPSPNFYIGMRSFGRSASWIAPGAFFDMNGLEIDDTVLRGRLFSSRDYTRAVSWQPEFSIAPIGVNDQQCVQSHVQRAGDPAATNITTMLRGMIGDNFAIVPRNMRLSASAAAAVFINGNIVVMSRVLGRSIPARARLPWGYSEDIDWGSRLAECVSPEENAFIGVQFLKPKMIEYNLSVTNILREWLMRYGHGVVAVPEELPPAFWCNSTWDCEPAILN